MPDSLKPPLDEPLGPPPDPPEVPPPGRATRPSVPSGADSLSAMTPRFNLFFRWFARRFFCHFDLDDATVESLRALEDDGSVVFVMRYASRLDYFLFNELFRREGLQLSRFANGIHFHGYRPLWAFLAAVFGRLRASSAATPQERALETVRELTSAGEPFFLFLRTARLRNMIGGRRQAIEQGRSELALLEAVVEQAWDGEHPVAIVPLALFWKKGPRARTRFLNLSYGASTRPSDLAKVTSFLTTYRGLHVKVGQAIDLGAFIDSRRAEGPFAVARKVRRSILAFLYREEKVVEGPALRPRGKVQDIVVGAPEVEAVVLEQARQREIPVDRARAEAAKCFREIAANQNSTFLGILNLIVSGILRRIFKSIELTGIEKIAEYAKRNPVVLAPSHRSYFDFLIISIVFYANHLVPPHIAARENMAFGPMGYVFRRAGAFFLRRSFDDEIYKAVFRSYVTYLVREGFTQEFFIEGGRSRTGKALQPKLGLLTWDLDAFLASSRRDLFFVPTAITYERLVEEGVMVGELEGESKSDETMMGLVRARKYLQRRFGTVHVNFGEPISLAAALGDRREYFARDDSPEVEAEQRIFVEQLGYRIIERINWAAVPNATAIAACAMLGSRSRGIFRSELARRMHELVELLQLQDVRLTPALRKDAPEFSVSLASMLRTELLKSSPDPRGEVFYFEEGARRALDIYRNSIVHYLAAPSFLARRLLAGPAPGDLRADLAEWLDIFYGEYFVPRGEILAAHFDAFCDHFERVGWIERVDGQLTATEKGGPEFQFLAEQTRGVVEVYAATLAAVAALEGDLGAKAIVEHTTDQYRRAELLGEVLRPESLNETTIRNAVALLCKRGILERSGERAARKGDVAYLRGPDFGDLEGLRERLAAALHAR